jgi:hypothetical protein
MHAAVATAILAWMGHRRSVQLLATSKVHEGIFLLEHQSLGMISGKDHGVVRLCWGGGTTKIWQTFVHLGEQKIYVIYWSGIPLMQHGLLDVIFIRSDAPG